MPDHAAHAHMVSADDFRRIALGLDDAIEGAHMGHPDFRVGGRIFASLHPGMKTGMVTLSPGDQRAFVHEHAPAFAPESGAWGRQGCTRVHLASVDDEALGEALTLAWREARAKGPTRKQAGRRKRARILSEEH